MLFRLTIVSFLFFSCSGIRLIQEYDSISDNKITSLQEKTSRFFIKAERQIDQSQFTYDSYINFYDDVKTDINVLLVRSRAIQKTDIIQKQLNSLLIQINSLEELHKKKIKSKEELEPIKKAIESSYTAIIQFQLALKNK
jgi:Xaa-Pro aminopeptidase